MAGLTAAGLTLRAADAPATLARRLEIFLAAVLPSAWTFLVTVREHREHLRAVLPRFNGRLIGEIGDGTLSSFHSAVDAVNCARELQATLVEDQELRLRIGIHVGDVVFTDKTLLGDGVNIASHIHELAPPGGCCISERVYEEIRNKPEIQVKDLGEQHLKNVARPIRAYSLSLAGDPAGRYTSARQNSPSSA